MVPLESTCNVNLIPGLGSSPGEGNGYLLQYPGLENSMDYSPWGQKKKKSSNKNYGLCSSVQFSRSVMSNSLRPHEWQHARPPCPSPTPGVHSYSRLSSQWCHPAISPSVVPFSKWGKSGEKDIMMVFSYLLLKKNKDLIWSGKLM